MTAGVTVVLLVALYGAIVWKTRHRDRRPQVSRTWLDDFWREGK